MVRPGGGRPRFLRWMMGAVLLFAVFYNFGLNARAAAAKRIVVYFTNWAVYNDSQRRFQVGDIPWDKVTHINHAFLTVDQHYRLGFVDSWADTGMVFEHSQTFPGGIKGHFGEYRYYKSIYPHVKVLVSVGGWTRSENFHAMAGNQKNRQAFALSCVNFLYKYPFIDGLDIDWEFPGINRPADPRNIYDRGCPGGPEDRRNFTLLLKTIRQYLNNSGLGTKLLTVTIPGGYNLFNMQEPGLYHNYVDYINVKTYDMHGYWENITNHHAPVFSNPYDPSPVYPVDIKNKYNTDAAMRYLRDVLGVPAEKLNAGTPYYARGWAGVSGGPAGNGLYVHASGPAPGVWDNPGIPEGKSPYFTMKQLEFSPGYTKYRDSYAGVPWLYNRESGLMFTYEDPVSLGIRCDYIIKNGFGGINVWEISGDDAGHTLTNTIYNVLGGVVPPVSVSPVSTVTPTPAPATPTTTTSPVPTITPTPAKTPSPVKTPSLIPSPAITPSITPTTTRAASATPSPTPTTGPTPSAAWPGRYKIVGYVAGWSDLTGVDIRADQMTHINYAFANVRNAEIVLEQPTDPVNFNKLKQLKAAYPHLKTLISIGGWNAGIEGFRYAALTHDNRTRFADSCARFITANGFDGVDLDWEYPQSVDRSNFTLLIKAMRERLDMQGAADNKHYILTIAAGAGIQYAQNTELGVIQQYLDWINLMAYDFGAARHNANLYNSSFRGSTGISCDSAVKILLDEGVPSGKITLGVPFHGRANTLWPTYKTLVQNYINRNGYTRYWDDIAKAPYLLDGGGNFVTYDDAESLGHKTNYIKAKNLAGVMFWEYSQDYMGSLRYKLYTDLK